jgi:L-ascorbate metabolism protein UlaG (beta-lactamase superfamily)
LRECEKQIIREVVGSDRVGSGRDASGCVRHVFLAQNVKITPLGTHAGELCDRDRAIIFEDPTGVRLLYDVGQSTMGADDPRLGDIHAVLLSHAHGDHIGDQKMKALGAGACEKPDAVPAGANSVTAEVAAAKNAAIVIVVDLSVFIRKKVEGLTGKPTLACPQSGGATSVPVAAHAVNELIRPTAVIATHVNEGATADGKLKPNSRTAAFLKLSKRPVHLAISGRTMEFDGSGKCVAGCS